MQSRILFNCFGFQVSTRWTHDFEFECGREWMNALMWHSLGTGKCCARLKSIVKCRFKKFCPRAAFSRLFPKPRPKISSTIFFKHFPHPFPHFRPSYAPFAHQPVTAHKQTVPNKQLRCTVPPFYPLSPLLRRMANKKHWAKIDVHKRVANKWTKQNKQKKSWKKNCGGTGWRKLGPVHISAEHSPSVNKKEKCHTVKNPSNLWESSTDWIPILSFPSLCWCYLCNFNFQIGLKVINQLSF